MALDQQLQRWKDAQLISVDQAQQILEFEKRRQRPALLYAVAGLAGFAVAIGLVSIVAANWALIPGRMKLALDALVLIVAGQAVVHFRTRPPGWLGDAASVVFYGLVLASIALVGQVYQLGGNVPQALMLWSALTFAVMAQGSSSRLAVLWVAGLHVTYFVCLSDFADGGEQRTELTLAAVYWAPLATLLAGRSRWLQRVRPAYAEIFRALGWSELILVSCLASFAFYDSMARGERIPWLIVGVSLLATLGLCLGSEQTLAGRAQRLLLAVTFAASHLPIFMAHGKWPLGAAASFIGVFAVVAWAAHRRGRHRLLHLATAMIAMRLLVVYFEVFSSLLDTGMGLVLGGLLTLLLTWLWARKRRDFDRELSARESAP
jgi:uncharacterized membrane protein